MTRFQAAVLLALIGALAALSIVGCGDDDSDTGSDEVAGDEESDDDTTDDDAGGDDDDAAGGVTGLFDPAESLGFYSLPFPIDLRLKEDGTLRVADFPNPRGSVLLTDYLAVGERDVKGFGANSGIFFVFTEPIDPDTLPAGPYASMGGDASVYLVGIDPASPDYGVRYPLRFKYTQAESVYAPANLLVALPVQGATMLHGRTYAAVVTTGVKTQNGGALVPNPELAAVLDGTSAYTRAVEVFAPLAGYLADTGVALDDVAVATVFTTQDPLARMLALRDHAYSVPLPGVRPASLAVESDEGSYTFVSGEVTIPIYQEGQVPYLVDGGGIRFDAAGAPIVQYELTTRLSITLPKTAMPLAGWPFLVHSHGSGGSWTSHINNGTAHWLALKGIATVAIDAPHHGPRNPISDESGFESYCFYNALNPDAFRDNNVQAAAELMAVLRQVLDLSIPESLVPNGGDGDHVFDFDAALFMGHSQGSTVGPLLVAVDPYVKAAYFSGAGASLLWNMLTKERPFEILPLVRIGLGLTGDEAAGELDEFHPVLNLLQHMAEMVDTLSYAPYFYSREVPGAAPKDVFQGQGTTDTYVGFPCHGSFGAAARMDLIEPVVGPDALDRMELTGGTVLEDTGVSGNRLSYDGTPMTAAAVQYGAPPDGADGHYITYRFPAMHRRVACFFRTYLDDGIATIVDDSGDENSTCALSR